MSTNVGDRVLSRVSAPWLRELTPDSVRVFCDRMRRYREDGGNMEMYKCVESGLARYVEMVSDDGMEARSESVVKSLEDSVVKSLDGDDEMEDIDSKHGLNALDRRYMEKLWQCVGVDATEILRDLNARVMQGQGPLALASYSAGFCGLWDQLSTEVQRRIESSVVKTYIKGIKPQWMAHDLEMRQELTGKWSLNVAMREALKEVKQYDRKSGAEQERAGSREAVRSSGGPFPYKCRKCGKKGHKAVDCRTKSTVSVGGSQSSSPMQAAAKPAKPSASWVAGGEQQPRPPAPRPVRQVTCFKCQKPGHIARYCSGEEAAVSALEAGQMGVQAKQLTVNHVKLSGVDVGTALVDTGADRSVMSRMVLDSIMRRTPVEVSLTAVDVKLVDGQQLRADMIASVAVDAYPLKGDARMLVLDRVTGPQVILGMDVINQSPVQLLPGQGLVGIPDPDIPADICEVHADMVNKEVTSDDCPEDFRQEFPTLFSGLQTQGEGCKLREFEIETGDTPPIHEAPHRLPPVRSERLMLEVERLKELGVVRESSSPWAFPAFGVPKKGANEVRLVVDYGSLNKRTKVPRHPLPIIEDIWQHLEGKTWFATLDLAKGYHQVNVRPRDIEKTAFVLQRGQFEFLKMPMGVSGAPAHFQREMERILAGLLFTACIAYEDDVIVFGESWEVYRSNLRRVLRRLAEANMRLNPQKCKFDAQQVAFLGFVVDNQWRRISPERKEVLGMLKPPKSKKATRSYLGLVNYFMKFIPSLSRIAAPLYELVKDKVDFRWDEAHQRAFEKIQQAMQDAPVLAHPDLSKDFILRTDASGEAIGAQLLQEKDQSEVPIAFMSRRLSEGERKWPTIEQEAFAIVTAFQTWNTWLLLARTRVQTDHKNLIWMKSSSNARVQRWRVKLSEYDFTIEHIPGRKNVVADALSRLNVMQTGYVVDLYQEVLKDRITRFRQAQECAEQEEMDAWKALGAEWDKSKKLYIIPDTEAVCVSDNAAHLLTELLQEAHEERVAGHVGIKETLRRLNKVHWNHKRQHVEQFVQSCPRCQTSKMVRQKYGKLLPWRADHPFQVVHLDWVGPLPYDKGKRYVLTMIDRFSRWTELVTFGRASALNVIRALSSRWIYRLGIPQIIVTDNAQCFLAPVVKSLAERYGIQLKQIAVYSPQANGIVERRNRELGNLLRLYSVDNEWVNELPRIQQAINTTTCRSTGFAPYEILFGMSYDWVSKIAGVGEQPVIRADLDEWREMVRQNQQTADEKAQFYYNKGRKDLEFQAGDLVMHLNPLYGPVRNKLDPIWLGPYRVCTRLNPVVYELQDAQGRHMKCHLRRLKKYNVRGETVPEGVEKLTLFPELEEAKPCQVLTHRFVDEDLQLHVQWPQGPWEEREPTWESVYTVSGNSGVREYLQEHKHELAQFSLRWEEDTEHADQGVTIPLKEQAQELKEQAQELKEQVQEVIEQEQELPLSEEAQEHLEELKSSDEGPAKDEEGQIWREVTVEDPGGDTQTLATAHQQTFEGASQVQDEDQQHEELVGAALKKGENVVQALTRSGRRARLPAWQRSGEWETARRR